MSLLANKFTVSEDFLNRVCENLKQEPDTSSIYLSFVEDVCIAKRIEIVGCWTEDLYRIAEKSEVSMNDEAWFSIRADTFIEMRERFLKDTKPCHTFNILEDSYGVQTLNVIVEDRAEYGAPVSVLRKPYDPRDARKGINTVSIEEVTVLNVFRRNNLKYVSIDESLQELIRSVRVTARSENRSCGGSVRSNIGNPVQAHAILRSPAMRNPGIGISRRGKFLQLTPAAALLSRAVTASAQQKKISRISKRQTILCLVEIHPVHLRRMLQRKHIGAMLIQLHKI